MDYTRGLCFLFFESYTSTIYVSYCLILTLAVVEVWLASDPFPPSSYCTCRQRTLNTVSKKKKSAVNNMQHFVGHIVSVDRVLRRCFVLIPCQLETRPPRLLDLVFLQEVLAGWVLGGKAIIIYLRWLLGRNDGPHLWPPEGRMAGHYRPSHDGTLHLRRLLGGAGNSLHRRKYRQ